MVAQDLGQQYVSILHFCLSMSLCIWLRHSVLFLNACLLLQLVCFYYVLTTFTTVGYGKPSFDLFMAKPWRNWLWENSWQEIFLLLLQERGLVSPLKFTFYVQCIVDTMHWCCFRYFASSSFSLQRHCLVQLLLKLMKLWRKWQQRKKTWMSF